MKYSVYIFSFLFVCLFSCKNTNTTEVNHDDFIRIHSDFKLFSKAVENGVLLDAFKCENKIDGVENSIPLSWENVPEGTNSLAIVMYHYPKTNNIKEINSYLLLWDIDPSVTEIPYKMAAKGDWFMGANKDGNAISYTSPCSHGKGKHEYTIALYALAETPPNLPKKNSLSVDYNQFMNAMATIKIIDRTTLTFLDTK
ncbi:YbhB/YbcL family Raf kinase inhibitor-like protein [Maribacter sp.]|uniref:YbhB/YbcL family Raf kinase inhibitor-like protein n=1 Tax=Maribacter sp. TaxID=1897614 RepID=UPI00329965E0